MTTESLELSTRRAAELLLTLSAAGEIGVGLLVALLPGTVMGLLLGAPVTGTAAVAARMMGIAVVGLGLTWWPDRNSLDALRRSQLAAGFIGFNVGVGLLFLFYAWAADRTLPVSWLVAAVHLLAAGAFAVIVIRAGAATAR